MDNPELFQIYLDELWINSLNLLETLRLIEKSRLTEMFMQNALSWRLEAATLHETHDGLRLFLQIARQLHPLPSKFDRQLGGLEPSSPLASSMVAAAKIMPHRLLSENLDLVKKAARRYHISTKVENDAEFQELLSVGAEAMVVAAQKYYQRPKGSFKNFVFPLLRTSMREEQARRHPVPFKIRKKLGALGRLREEAHLRELSLSPDAIAKSLRLAPEELRELLQIEGVWGNGTELQTGLDLEDLEIADHSLDQLSQLLQIEDQQRLDQAMQSLQVPEKTVIKKLYLEEKSLREVAEELELSLPSFKKLHRKTLTDLKRSLNGA